MEQGTLSKFLPRTVRPSVKTTQRATIAGIPDTYGVLMVLENGKVSHLSHTCRLHHSAYELFHSRYRDKHNIVMLYRVCSDEPYAKKVGEYLKKQLPIGFVLCCYKEESLHSVTLPSGAKRALTVHNMRSYSHAVGVYKRREAMTGRPIDPWAQRRRSIELMTKDERKAYFRNRNIEVEV